MPNNLDAIYYKLHPATLACLRCPVPRGCVYDLQGAAGICPLGVPDINNPTQTYKRQHRPHEEWVRDMRRGHRLRAIAKIKDEILPHLPATIPELAKAVGLGRSTLHSWVTKGYLKAKIRPGAHQRPPSKLIVGLGENGR